MAEMQDLILIITRDARASEALQKPLRSAGYSVAVFRDSPDWLEQASGAALVLLVEQPGTSTWIETIGEIARRFPTLPVILVASQDSSELLKRSMRLGVVDFLAPPVSPAELVQAVRVAVERAGRQNAAILHQSAIEPSRMQLRIRDLETLAWLSRTVSASLDFEHVATAIVDAAIQLTGAEESSLMLLDESGTELFVRAVRAAAEKSARSVNVPAQDSLAAAVIRAGEPVSIRKGASQEEQAASLQPSLLYVPLSHTGHVFGVLGVANRSVPQPFTKHHAVLLGAFAEDAAAALENARQFAQAAGERAWLQSLLAKLPDGLLVIDQDMRLKFANPSAYAAFGIDPEPGQVGRPFADIFQQDELLRLAAAPESRLTNRTEINFDENCAFSAHGVQLPDGSRMIAFYDVSDFKKLDQMKTDFVYTISHDLRSPLTAILGYVELIERAGPVSDLQRDFVRRVQSSVHHITRLVDNLLELGRIEAGFELRKESVSLEYTVRIAIENLKKMINQKGHVLRLSFPANFPAVLANPTQMNQMVTHLLENAIQYTLPGGDIQITGYTEQDQVILRISDNGIGIPLVDLPFVFDKFYRAANASVEATGTGLGLSIVKSIVENHGGRIWAESTMGKGTEFSVVLPMFSA